MLRHPSKETVMSRRPLCLLITLAGAMAGLSACAYTEPQAGFERYKGDPVSELVPRLGPPSGEQDVAGRHTYVWSTNGALEASHLNCALRVYVDSNQRIEDGIWEGNPGTCQYYAQKMLTMMR
jgi:hypothetical protein